MVFRRFHVLLSLPILLSGCVVGPDYQRPETATAVTRSGNSGEQLKLDNWWQSLNDPILDQLISLGIENNLDFATAKARVRQARASLEATGAVLVPQLDLAGNLTRGGAASDGPTTQTGSAFTSQWEIDLFGGNRRGVEAAFRDLEGTREELRAGLVTLTSDIVMNYIQIRGIQSRIAVAQENARIQNKTVGLTKTRVDAGYVSPVDLLRAKTQAASTSAQIPPLRIAFSNYIGVLGILTGETAFALTEKLTKPGKIPVVPTISQTVIPAAIIAARPDIRAAERYYASSVARIGKAEAARYPSLSIGGSINTSGTKLGDLAQLSSLSWNLGPSVTLPVFNGGRLKADVESAQALRDQSFFAYKKAVLTALAEIETGIVGLNQNKIRIRQQQTILANSREINRVILDQYRSGRQSFIDVLNSQRDLLSAETALSQARIDAAISYTDLQRALGGSWSGVVDIETPRIVDRNMGPRLTRSNREIVR